MQIISVDKLNRDYQPDQYVKYTVSTEEDAKDKCDLFNFLSKERFFKVVPDNYKMDFKSIYDCNGITPTFEQWLSLSNAAILQPDAALQIYKEYYNLSQ